MAEVLSKLLLLQARVTARTRLDACDRALVWMTERLLVLAEAREVFAGEAAQVEWICEDEAYLLAARGCAVAHREAGMAYRRFQEAFEAVPADARQEDLVKLAACFTVERHALSMYDAPTLRRLAKSYKELSQEPYLFDPRERAASESGEHECEGP